MSEQHLLWVIAGLGFALHFVGRYGEYRRAVEKVWPWAYVAQDPPAWVGAVIGTVIAVLVLPDIEAVLAAFQLPAQLVEKVRLAWRLLYFCAGYAGSSVIAKVPGMLFPGLSNPTQR